MTEEDYISTVCQNVKNLRVSKKLTQVELAASVGIDDSSLRRIESGRTSPTLKTLYRLATALEVNVIDLLPSQG